MEKDLDKGPEITPFLWFDNNAEEAMQFYTALFTTATIKSITRYGDAGPGPKGTLLTGVMELNGQEFIVLNGGPTYHFTPAVSFVIHCTSQAEVDHYWQALSEGGREDRCGWLQDKFGLSWQVAPTILGKMLGDKDAAKAGRVMKAMLQMKKLHIPTLQQAYENANSTEVAV